MCSPQTWALHGGSVCVGVEAMRSRRHRLLGHGPRGLRKAHETCGYGKQLRQSLAYGVRYVACHVQVVSLLSFLGPPWCQWCSDWSALGCSATVASGCVCSSLVSGWLTSIEVFAAVPLGVSCFLSTSRVLGTGASGMGANAVDKK